MAKSIQVDFEQIANRNVQLVKLPEFQRVLTILSSHIITIWRPTPPKKNEMLLAAKLVGFPRIGRAARHIVLPHTETVTRFGFMMSKAVVGLLCRNHIEAIYRNGTETDRIRGGKEVILKTTYIPDGGNASQISFWIERIK